MLKALKKRRAIRQFEAREVEREKIEKLLEAAIYAPNDRMREPWHFYVMQGDSLKGYEAGGTQFFRKAFSDKTTFS